MSQTSGSITIETTGLTASIVAGLEPVLNRIADAITALNQTIGSVPLSEQESARVIEQYLPLLTSAGGGISLDRRDVAAELANELIQAGYTLVQLPVSGPDLRAELTAELGTAALKLVREEEWFSRNGGDHR